MGLIPIQIPEQNYELIRKRIGEILTLELADQEETENVGVWLERTISFNYTELPAVNITFENAPYDNHDYAGRRGANKFYIDIHGNAKHTESDNGDKLAAVNVQRIAGIIMYILSSPEYVRLGFEPGFISSRLINDITVGQVKEPDSRHSYVARITFTVVAGEFVGSIEGVDIEDIFTTVKLEDTEFGYTFRVSNLEAIEEFIDSTEFTETSVFV